MATDRRSITIVKASERVAHGIDCAHCPKDALIITQGGIMCWKSPHRNQNGNIEAHPNAVGMGTLFQWYVSVCKNNARVTELIDMRRAIDEALEKAA